MNEPFLAFEVDAAGEQLFIHADPQGMRHLARHLEALAQRVEQRGPEHTHLFSEEWGDGEISSERQSEDGHVIHHVKILGWPVQLDR